jgi:GT2 family glycosyltransferase
LLSIIIVNFKNPHLLRLCLKTISDTVSQDFKKEIIVVDIASSVETRNVASEFSGVKVIPFRANIGYTKGVNEGIKNSLGDAYLILNPDVIILKDSIENMYDYLKVNSSIGMISPQLLNMDGTPQESFFRFPSPVDLFYRRTFLGKLPFGKKRNDRFVMRDAGYNSTHTADWLMGSALMISKEVVDEVGLMDEQMFLYMSDIDWPLRFWENGYKVVYYPKAKVYHYHKRDSKGKFGIFDFILKKESRWHLIDAIRYFRKHGYSARSYCS